MSWIKFKRILFAPISELKMRRSLCKKYHLRSIQDIVRKFEETKFKALEAERINDKDGVQYYKAALEVLAWVIHDDQKNN